MLESMDKGKAKNKIPTIKRGLKERNHRLRACEKTLRKAKKKEKEKEWKLPTLKGKSKIMGGKRLSSLERAKKVSIKKRHSIHQKSILEKNTELQTLSFGINDKAFNE
jgi:hypothetical protein